MAEITRFAAGIGVEMVAGVDPILAKLGGNEIFRVAVDGKIYTNGEMFAAGNNYKGSWTPSSESPSPPDALPGAGDIWFCLGDWGLSWVAGDFAVWIDDYGWMRIPGRVALDRKADLVEGKGLSVEDFTAELKAKLEGLSDNYRGYHEDQAALMAALPVGQGGWYATVESTDTIWIWDTKTEAWVNTGSSSANGSGENVGTGVEVFAGLDVGTMLFRTIAGADGVSVFRVGTAPTIQIKYQVEARTSDYAANADNLGKMWMRSDIAETLKVVVPGSGGAMAWSAGATMLATNNQRCGFGGITSAVCAGGSYTAIGGEKFNGVTWTAYGLLWIGAHSGACGSENAALLVAGRVGASILSPSVSRWDGVALSAAASLAAGERFALFGTASAAVLAGGNVAANTSTYTPTTSSAVFNGVTWSVTGSVGVAKDMNGGCGTPTAGIEFGGQHSNSGYRIDDGTAHLFNGLAWTSASPLNSSYTNALHVSGCGTQTQALCCKRYAEKYEAGSWVSQSEIGSVTCSAGGVGGAVAYGYNRAMIYGMPVVGFCVKKIKLED